MTQGLAVTLTADLLSGQHWINKDLAPFKKIFALSKCFCFVRIRLRNHLLSSEFCNRCLAALDIGAGVEQPFDEKFPVVSSSRTVRPCSPWGGRWIGHWRTTWLAVCSSAPHSQTAEEAIPHSYRQERKRTTPVQRRLSRIQALLERVIPRRWVPMSGMKVRSLVRLLNHSAFHWWSSHCAARMWLLSDKLMSCCAAGTNGCKALQIKGAIV